MEQFFGNINLGLVGAIIFLVYMLRSFITIPDKYAILLPMGFGIVINMMPQIMSGQFLFTNFSEGFTNGMAAAYFFKIGKSFNPFSKNGKNGGQ